MTKAPRIRDPYILATVMPKGGVGKTTVTANLAAALAHHLQMRVAVIDMDPSHNMTYCLTGRSEGFERSFGDLATGRATMVEALVGTRVSGLSVVPGAINVSMMLGRVPSSQQAIHFQAFRDRILYDPRDQVNADLIMLDTPPTIGLLLHFALTAADGILIVAEPTPFGTQGLGDLVPEIRRVRETFSAPVPVAGVVINKLATTTHLNMEYVRAFEDEFGAVIFRPMVPYREVMKRTAQNGPLEVGEDEDPETRAELRAMFRTLAGAVSDRIGSVVATRTPAHMAKVMS